MANSGPGISLEAISCSYCGSDKSSPITSGYDYEYRTTNDQFFFVECRECSHVFLNPRPTIESAGIIYPSDYYTFQGRHEKSSSSIVSFFKQIVIQSRIPPIPAGLRDKPFGILEVGCGDCSLLVELKKKYPLADCTGLDLRFTPAQQETCDKHGIKLVASPIEEADLGENRFDLVIMNQLIEHTWHPVEVLKKIARALKSGGQITISTVDLDGYDRKFFYDHFWGGYYIPRHLHLFNGKTLRATLEKSGLAFEKHKSLVAPIVWIFSFHARLTSSPAGILRWLGRYMVDRNPLLLGIFTIVDIVALAIGLTTSNQQVIAKKP